MFPFAGQTAGPNELIFFRIISIKKNRILLLTKNFSSKIQFFSISDF